MKQIIVFDHAACRWSCPKILDDTDHIYDAFLDAMAALIAKRTGGQKESIAHALHRGIEMPLGAKCKYHILTDSEKETRLLRAEFYTNTEEYCGMPFTHYAHIRGFKELPKDSAYADTLSLPNKFIDDTIDVIVTDVPKHGGTGDYQALFYNAESGTLFVGQQAYPAGDAKRILEDITVSKIWHLGFRGYVKTDEEAREMIRKEDFRSAGSGCHTRTSMRMADSNPPMGTAAVAYDDFYELIALVPIGTFDALDIHPKAFPYGRVDKDGMFIP